MKLPPRRWLVVGGLLGLLGLGGCAGSAHLELVSLNYRSIDPPGPRAARLDLDCCYWWLDADGHVCVAMQYERRPPFTGFARFLFQMSLALDDPPAGRARNYKIGAHGLRALARVGPVESRFTSANGIVAVYNAPGERLRGSFRLLTRRWVSRLLGGWGRPSSYLMQGTFEAVGDEARGRAIAAASESHGWERGPLVQKAPPNAPASQPRE